MFDLFQIILQFQVKINSIFVKIEYCCILKPFLTNLTGIGGDPWKNKGFPRHDWADGNEISSPDGHGNMNNFDMSVHLFPAGGAERMIAGIGRFYKYINNVAAEWSGGSGGRGKGRGRSMNVPTIGYAPIRRDAMHGVRLTTRNLIRLAFDWPPSIKGNVVKFRATTSQPLRGSSPGQ